MTDSESLRHTIKVELKLRNICVFSSEGEKIEIFDWNLNCQYIHEFVKNI